MTFKYFRKTALLFAITIIGSTTLNAQEKDSLIQQRIRQQEYNFVPMSGSSPTIAMPILNREYEFRVTVDSIVANLPYFGKSYTPQFGRSDDDGIRFVSTNFHYSAVAKKKGKWEITIEPKDAKGIRLFLTVFSNGDAKMDVINPGKQTILFNGYVW